MRCGYHNDPTSTKKLAACGVWAMENTLTSARKEFSWVINLCLILPFPS